MNNCSNVQEFRNFEAKFINIPQKNDFHNSTMENNAETVNGLKIDELKNFFYNQKHFNSESKTVRCVIKKEFEGTLKKLNREDGSSLGSLPVRPNQGEEGTLTLAVVDKIRLQNHLKWKKQKDEEFYQKKEAEKIAQQKKKEEELLMEKIKKQQEKKREEKLREWQEQKIREKEEKKKEKMVMKVLEEELKEATPIVNKEKLIEEWVKLKNKQKQLEAEKKAEILKKEEEDRVLRQNLSKLSYKQWKERVKDKILTLPKNGYQIFGPKPAVVVKEDWNHNFTSTSPRGQTFVLRSTTSNTTASAAFRPEMKLSENFLKSTFDHKDLKSRSASFCELTPSKSGLNLCKGNRIFNTDEFEMPLKELQPETIDLKKKFIENIKNDVEEKEDFGFCSNAPYYILEEGDQNYFSDEPLFKKLSKLKINEFPLNQILPNKKKANAYIKTCLENAKSKSSELNYKKKLLKNNDFKCEQETENRNEENKIFIEKRKNRNLKEKTSVQKRASGDHKETSSKKALTFGEKKNSESEIPKGKICRTSRSYDKPVKKFIKDLGNSKSCSASKSFSKISSQTELCKPLNLGKSKITNHQKRRNRRSKPSTPEVSNTNNNNNNIKESDSKSKIKAKKKNFNVSKSFSFTDSPYAIKKTSKSLDKGKVNLKKSERCSGVKSARASKNDLL